MKKKLFKINESRNRSIKRINWMLFLVIQLMAINFGLSQTNISKMEVKKVVEIIQYTDPVCTWCWGSEPVIRALETKYGTQVKTSYVMGGLVKDITQFSDGPIGGDPIKSNKFIALHWEEASSRHGMPVKSEGFQLFTLENPSTYPQNIAYKAAQMQNEEKANRFLRRLREATAAEAKVTSTTEVLLELASEVGLDIAQFLDDYQNGKAEVAFKEDLRITVENGVRGFPAFLIKYGDKSIMLKGYRSYTDFKAIITNLSGGEIKENNKVANVETVLTFVKSYGSAAPVEVKIAFDLSEEKYKELEQVLIEKNKVSKKIAGNGYFLIPSGNPMSCDPKTKTCGN